MPKLNTEDAWWTADTAPAAAIHAAGGKRGHYWVFDLKSMVELIFESNEKYGLDWEILEMQETDDKVGNGHTVVAQYMPTPSQTEADDEEIIPLGDRVFLPGDGLLSIANPETGEIDPPARMMRKRKKKEELPPDGD